MTRLSDMFPRINYHAGLQIGYYNLIRSTFGYVEEQICGPKSIGIAGKDIGWYLENILATFLDLPNHTLRFHPHTSVDMSSKAPIALILGSGPNIGQHVAQAFSAKGYKIVLASRSPKSVDKVSDQVHITSDLSDPSSVAKVFEQVKALGNPPSVVVYNGKQHPQLPLSVH